MLTAMSEPLIRKAHAGDLPTVNRLLEQVLKLHHDGRPDLFPPTGKKYTDFCELQVPHSHNLNPIKTLYIDDLCVDESCRGRHVGQALFAYAKAFAAAEGCHNITLHVWEKNPAARAFYEAQGLTVQYTSMEMTLD